MIAVKFRTYYSIQHLKSAYLLSHESKLIESSYLSSMDGLEKVELSSRNNAFATCSIFSSISFLEATINEIICDIVECEDRVKFISDEDKEIIRNAWLKTGNDSLDRRSVLKKYQFILKTLHAEILDNTSESYQNIEAILELRHTLVHFKPEWNSIHSPYISESENQHRLLEKLQGKFELSSFYKDLANPFFPNKCIGYGCSKWSFENILIFADDFHNRIGMKSIYEHVRNEIVYT